MGLPLQEALPPALIILIVFGIGISLVGEWKYNLKTNLQDQIKSSKIIGLIWFNIILWILIIIQAILTYNGWSLFNGLFL
jgi:hypothetical protein